MFQQPTDKGNGTEIIIPVKQGDKYLFQEAISEQLLFCNIELKNFAVNLVTGISCEDEDFILTSRADSLKLLNGKILYKIDLNNPQLAAYSNLKSLTGVVVKCNIGDVKVTLSREDLDYTGKTIELLKSKFDKVKNKLKEGYIESINKCTTFREFNNLYENQIKPKIRLNSYSNAIFTWQDFEDVVFNNYRPFRLLQEGYYAQIINKIQRTYWVSARKSYTYSNTFYSYTYNPSSYLQFQEDGVWDKEMQEWLGSNARAIKVDIPAITPKQELVADLVYFCEDVMKEVDALPKLSEKREEFLAWRKEQRKLGKIANVRLNGTYPVSRVSYPRYESDNLWWYRDEVKLTDKDLEDYVFIGNQEDKERLENFLVLCRLFLDKTYTGYIVSIPNTKHFTQRRAIHIKDIMKDHPITRSIVTQAILSEFCQKNSIYYQYSKHQSYAKQLNPMYAEVMSRLAQVKSVTFYNNELLKELKDLGLKNGWYNRDINLINHYNNFMKGIELFKYVELTEESLPLAKEYLKEKGKLQEQVPVNQLKLEEIND